MSDPTRRSVAVAGHPATRRRPRRAARRTDPAVRAAALGALERLGVLDDGDVAGGARRSRPAASAGAPRRWPPATRRRPRWPRSATPIASVVEVAAWACGERRARRRRDARPAWSRWRGGQRRSARARVERRRARRDRRRPRPRRDPRRHRRQAGDPPPCRARAGAVPRPRSSAGRRGRRGAASAPSPTATGRSAKPPRTSTATSCGRQSRCPSHPPGGRSDDSKRVAVDVGVAGVEADALVEAVGRLPLRARREVDLLGAAPAGLVERRPAERLADAVATRCGVDDDVVDPRLQPGRERVHRQREAADDVAVDVGRRTARSCRCRRSSARPSRPGGGADVESWGINRSNAATSSSSTLVTISISTLTAPRR